VPSQRSWLERTSAATLESAGGRRDDALADQGVAPDELPLDLVERPGLERMSSGIATLPTS
jgi:hypothetical protein